MHPYQPKWRGARGPRTVATNEPSPVTWIVAIGFFWIILIAFVLPVVEQLGRGR
jgi:hypothetical protein